MPKTSFAKEPLLKERKREASNTRREETILSRLRIGHTRFNTRLYVIYKALCFDVAQGRMNGAPNETRTHSCRSASLAC